ncbi:hypothetical protein FOZ61_003625 [Perkinsus olseni]|uniref:Uncharacterized protein n=1 Tax=Perkinsus olseni TaxID=32597 RepID=A0A7J6LNY2_PEROL|nr:hypothetical protein FOZ61_003625 [Perkinsus olseni]
MNSPHQPILALFLLAVCCQGSVQDTACESICSGVIGCGSSYCKSWKTPPHCFGILIKPDSSLCYAPADATCTGEEHPCEQTTATAAPSVGTPSVSDIVGSWCGTSPYPGGDFRITFDQTSVLLAIVDKIYTADYSLEGYEIVFSNYDDDFKQLLQALGSQPYAEYRASGLFIDFSGIFTDTASRHIPEHVCTVTMYV